MYLRLAQVVSMLMLNLVANAQETYVGKLSAATDLGASEAMANEKAVKPAQNSALKFSRRLEKFEELGLLSAALVEKAESGSSPAHDFRIQARMYRELLRQTMLRDRERPLDEQQPQDLLLEMVRMSALLHSAADCKTGFVITCPADLMLQLKSQQARVIQGLKTIRMLHD